ncbi:AlpA family phage regulatory protein [Xenorhabdus bovienii]|uniref:helix-turn-helix transcriptional regulator n=1 Tax=Xenorhabdus bovienii TaxID=40576 RepID=UPI000170A686|nr:AlpA family phage regulatory protein [Xenorhabdus bovienii]MCG3471763.1 AlpA family phage regulatory protein [Xenorhabdus bovienii]
MTKIKTLSLAQVMQKTRLSKLWIYQLMQQGNFPQPVRKKIGVDVWQEKAITDWLAIDESNTE